MEKKIVARTAQSATKLNNGDSSKFKQDGPQKFPKTSRKREGLRPDPAKKPIPQRSRASIDKRPRPRGVNLWDRGNSEVVEDALAEAGSVVQPGQKKVNLNHLLNFKLAPREAHPWIREKFRLPKYNKEQFLQANCQFVVEQDGEYAQHAANPDLLVDWSHVEEVRLPCFEVPSCPICLYQPSAAKITRCGHVYCWPCILHYLALSARTWCKCPICHESVMRDDLKSVMPAMKVSPAVQCEINMCLMQRQKGQLCALPVSSQRSSLSIQQGLFTINDDFSSTCFQKLLTATKTDVRHYVVERELAELQNLRIDSDSTEMIFIDESLELLQKRRSTLLHRDTPDEIAEKMQATNLEDDDAGYPEDAHPISAEMNSRFEAAPGASEDLGYRNSYFYFYQAADGQHIYLHPLNIRMLVEEYGSLDRSPENITAKIVDIERVTVTESVRRRLRYLQHLPLTCEFQVVELQLQPPFVSPATCDLFAAEVEKRRRTRNRKAREERRREKRIEMEENRKLGKFPEARYCLESNDQFPLCPIDLTSEADPPLEKSRPESSHSGSTVSSPSETTSSTSFAQMLRSGKARPDRSREVRECWPPEQRVAEGSDAEGDVAPPAYWQSFSDALDSCTIQQKSSGKGKKKKKQTLLFTTSINRSK